MRNPSDAANHNSRHAELVSASRFRHPGLAPESHSPRHCGPGFDPAFRHCGLAPQSGSFHYAEQRHPGLDPGSIQHLISRIYSGALSPPVFPESFRNFLLTRPPGIFPETYYLLSFRTCSGISTPSRHSGLDPESHTSGKHQT